jgi:hypothetical protein
MRYIVVYSCCVLVVAHRRSRGEKKGDRRSRTEHAFIHLFPAREREQAPATMRLKVKPELQKIL